LFEGYFEDAYALQKHKDFYDVLATFEKKKQNYNGFRVEWLQAYKFAKYIFSSKQTEKADDILVEFNKRFPDSIVNVTNYLAVGFNRKEQFQKAKSILDKIKIQGKNTALWHHQYSLALTGLNDIELAKTYQKQAMELAKKQKLPMWQIWEMK